MMGLVKGVSKMARHIAILGIYVKFWGCFCYINVQHFFLERRLRF